MRLVEMPRTGLHRAGRWSDVDQYPKAAAALSPLATQEDGYRWEDLAGGFSTVKCSVSAEAAIGRTIARYRPRVVEAPEEIGGTRGIINAIIDFLEGEPDFAAEPELIDGRVPDDVFDDLYAIRVPYRPDLQFVDLGHPDTIASLKGTLDDALVRLGAGPISRNLARERDRRTTRLITQLLHDAADRWRADQDLTVAGLRLPGQPDEAWEAYVLWCPPKLVDLAGDDIELRWISHWDDDTVRAAQTLGIELPPDLSSEGSEG